MAQGASEPQLVVEKQALQAGVVLVWPQPVRHSDELRPGQHALRAAHAALQLTPPPPPVPPPPPLPWLTPQAPALHRALKLQLPAGLLHEPLPVLPLMLPLHEVPSLLENVTLDPLTEPE